MAPSRTGEERRSSADGRMGRLARVLARRGIDLFLCARMTNVRYLTGFSGSDALLLVTGSGAALLTDGRYREQAGREVRGAEVVITDRKWTEAARRIRRARRNLGLRRAARIAFESRHLPVEAFRRLTGGDERHWVPLPDPVEALRMQKDLQELRTMEEAAIAASGALLRSLGEGIRGKREADVAADLERDMKRLGAEGGSFPVIVASGSRSSMPHAVPTRSVIGRGEGVVVDLGARRLGYCSDETVTVLPAAPSRELARVYGAVLRAQEEGIRRIRPGVRCRDVDAGVRESLDRSGYLKYFVHSTGHGVGLDIHERPSLSARSRDRLAEGMVVTVEPGVYIPGWGGVRIEDMVRVAATRGERLTYLPKHPALVA